MNCSSEGPIFESNAGNEGALPRRDRAGLAGPGGIAPSLLPPPSLWCSVGGDDGGNPSSPDSAAAEVGKPSGVGVVSPGGGATKTVLDAPLTLRVRT